MCISVFTLYIYIYSKPIKNTELMRFCFTLTIEYKTFSSLHYIYITYISKSKRLIFKLKISVNSNILTKLIAIISLNFLPCLINRIVGNNL